MSRLSRGDLGVLCVMILSHCSLMKLNITKVGLNILIKHIWEIT